MNTRDKLAKIVREHLGVEQSQITDAADFIDDLGCDSLDIVELTMAVEEEFGVEVSDSEAESAATFGQMVSLVEGKISGG